MGFAAEFPLAVVEWQAGERHGGGAAAMVALRSAAWQAVQLVR